MSSDHDGSLGYDFNKGFPSGVSTGGKPRQSYALNEGNAFTISSGIRGKNNNTGKSVKETRAEIKHRYKNKGNQKSFASDFRNTSLGASRLKSLKPGGMSTRNTVTGGMDKNITNQYNAGTSTFNSLPDAQSMYPNAYRYEDTMDEPVDSEYRAFSIPQQFQQAGAVPSADDIPIAPYSDQPPNFGNGQVDYGFVDPSRADFQNGVSRAFEERLPESDLSGIKASYAPKFSNANIMALDTRPIMQSKGSIKGRRYIDGTNTLPPHLYIDPMETLGAGSRVNTEIIETTGELAEAFRAMGRTGGSQTRQFGARSSFGPTLGNNRMVGQPRQTNYSDSFYMQPTTSKSEPSLFSQSGVTLTDEFNG